MPHVLVKSWPEQHWFKSVTYLIQILVNLLFNWQEKGIFHQIRGSGQFVLLVMMGLSWIMMLKSRNSILQSVCSCRGDCHAIIIAMAKKQRRTDQSSLWRYRPLWSNEMWFKRFVMCHTHNSPLSRQSVMTFTACTFIHFFTLSCTFTSIPHFHPCFLIYPCFLITPVSSFRSADEPMTTFVLCNECGKRWKFCWRIKTTLNVLFDLSRTNRTVPVIWCSIRKGLELSENIKITLSTWWRAFTNGLTQTENGNFFRVHELVEWGILMAHYRSHVR